MTSRIARMENPPFERETCSGSGVGEQEPAENWWSQAGSNRRPPHCERGALPAELWPLKDTQKREKYAVARLSSVGVIYGRGVGVSRSAMKATSPPDKASRLRCRRARIARSRRAAGRG